MAEYCSIVYMHHVLFIIHFLMATGFFHFWAVIHWPEHLHLNICFSCLSDYTNYYGNSVFSFLRNQPFLWSLCRFYISVLILSVTSDSLQPHGL